MTSDTISLEVFLPGDITFDPTSPIGMGGFGNLFKGSHPTRGTLALKCLRSRINEHSDPRTVYRVSLL